MQTEIMIGIDHTLVGVADLEAARKQWTRLGFTCTPRGSHIGWGTANYCIMFPEDYIEILGIVDPAQFTNNLDVFLESGEGGLGLAFHSKDVDVAKSALDSRGVQAGDPKDLARNLELPEGTVLPRFRLLFTDAEATPGLRAFICQHLTPEMLRRPEWLQHANGALRIADITAVIDDPAAAAPVYENIFGASACRIADGMLTITVGGHELRLLSRAAARSAYPGCVAEPTSGPLRMLAQSVAVTDLETTARWLEGRGISFGRPGGDRLRIAPADATGLVQDFVEERQ